MGKLGEKFVITKFFALAHFRIFLKSSRLSFFEKNYCRIAHFFLSKAGYLCVYAQRPVREALPPSIPKRSAVKSQSYIKLMID